jgi:hypothetical protein
MSKKIIAVFAAVLMMAAFFMPMTAYANEDRSALYEQYDMDSMTLEELLEIFTMTEILNYYSVFNVRDTDPDDTEPPAETEPPDIDETLDLADFLAMLQLFNMLGIENATESAVPDDSKAFTPDGQATVVDLAYEGDGKMFYTFKTPAGNVFYLIIDRQRGADNVYFLSAVTEDDLLDLAANPNKKNNGSTSAIPDNGTDKPDPNGGKDEKPTGTEKPGEADPPKQGGNTGMIIFLLIGAVILGGAGYYIKVIRPKQQRDMDDEDEGLDRNDDGGEMQFEDEQPEDTDGDGEYEVVDVLDEDE